MSSLPSMPGATSCPVCGHIFAHDALFCSMCGDGRPSEMDAAVMMAGNTTEGGDMDMPDAHGTAPAYQGPQDVPEEATAAAMEHHGWQDAEAA